MLDEEQGELVVEYARNVIQEQVVNDDLPEPPGKEFLSEKYGVFVTVKQDGELRGCIGIFENDYQLVKALESASCSVIDDPRFPPLSEEELDDVVIEVTILTEPELIEVDKPEDYKDSIEIGSDGLLIEHNDSSGLLLPQVPVEQGWDQDEFLTALSHKAGLSPEAWKDSNSDIYRFQGQIFHEESPKGEVVEKTIV